MAWYDSRDMKNLEGKVVTGLAVSKDESTLVFIHDDSTQTWYGAEGDCCSESWFADISGVSFLLNQEVLSADEVEMPDYNTEDGRTRQEYDSAYGYRITTNKRICDIVFRNSSNGYYGGWLTGANPLPLEEMVVISEDWQA